MNAQNSILEDKKLFKVLVYGPAGAGKTLLVRRYISGQFSHDYPATIGIDFATKEVVRNNIIYKLQIWDTAGQERYRCISSAYFRGAQGILLCYDISSEASFNSMIQYYEEMKTTMNQANLKIPPIMLCGLKNDLEDMRQVSPDCADAFAQSNYMTFIENSAKLNNHVDETFDLAIDLMVKSNSSNIQNKLSDSQSLQNQQAQKKKGGCC